MTRLKESELARLLGRRPEARAPEHLAQRIKAEIPERIAVGAGALRPHPDREHAVAYRQIVLLGALFVAAIAVALWGLRAMLAGHERDARQAELDRLLAGAAAPGFTGGIWLDPEAQPHAALPLHVDPASFTLFRTLLAGGRLPAPELVLTGSFVDAFDYGDPAPLKETLAIYAEGAVDPSGADRRVVRIALRTADVARAPAAPPVPVAYAATAGVTVDLGAVARYRVVADTPAGPRSTAAGTGDDLLPGHRVAVLVEIELLPRVTPDSRVATVSASWQHPSGATATLEHVMLARDLASRWDEAPSSLRLAALAADFARALAAHPGADSAALARVRREAESLAARYPNDQGIRDLAGIAARATDLARP
jgi:hypothetical protein